MKAEEHLENARIKRDQLKKEDKKKNTMTSVVLSMATLISIVFLFYAFQQKQRATKLEQDLLLIKNELELCQKK